MIVLAIVCLLLSAVNGVVLPCVLLNTNLASGGGGEINATCTQVVYVNVTLSGASAWINISIANMATVKPSPATIDISLSGLVLLDGAVLAINSTGWVPPSPAGATAPVVSIVVQNMTVTNGALLITGAFPPRTNILVVDSNLTANNNVTIVKFKSIVPDQYNGKLVLLMNLSLANSSTLSLERSSVVATASSPNTNPIVMFGKVTLAFSSTLSFTDLSVVRSSQAISILLDSAAVLVMEHSIWRMARVFANSTVMIQKSSIAITRSSFWQMDKLNFVALNQDTFKLDESVILVSESSTWTISESNMTATERYGMFINNSPVTIGRNSSWTIQRCSWLGAACAISIVRDEAPFVNIISVDEASSWRFEGSAFISRIAGSVTLVGAIAISNDSSFSLSRCSFVTSGFAGALVLGTTPPSVSAVSLTESSIWSITGCIFMSSFMSLTAPSIFFAFCSVIASNGSSWVIANSTATSAFGAAVVMPLKMIIANSSSVLFAGNEFTSGSSCAVSLTSGSRIVLSSLSSWQVVNGSLAGLCSIATSSSSIIELEGSSVWLVGGMRLVGQDKKGGASIQLGSGLAVGSLSLVMFRGNVIQISSSSTACVDAGVLHLADWGTVRFLDNNCSTSSSTASSSDADFLVGSEQDALPSTGLIVERCNTVDGVARHVVQMSLPRAVSLPCSRCDVTVDCFWSLAISTPFTKMACNEPCPCNARCGAVGSMCLPPLGIQWNGGGECEINKDPIPRLGITATATWYHGTTMTRTIVPNLPTTQPADQPKLTLAAGAAVGLASAASVAAGSADAHAIAIIGLAACAGAAARSLSSVSSYALSPFKDLGYAMMVVGNVGLLLVMATLHGLLARSRMSQRQGEPPAQRKVTWRAASASVLFPNRTIAAALVLQQGIIVGFGHSLGSSSSLEMLGIICGVAFAGCAVIIMRQFVSPIVSQLHFTPYNRRIARFPPWVKVWLPKGIWSPEISRKRIGFAVNTCDGNHRGLGLVPQGVTSVMAVIAVIDFQSSGLCGLQWALMAVPLVGWIAVMLACRPFRVPGRLLFHLVSSSLTLVLILCQAVGADATTVNGFATTQFVLSILSFGHQIVVTILERRWANTDGRRQGTTQRMEDVDDDADAFVAEAVAALCGTIREQTDHATDSRKTRKDALREVVNLVCLLATKPTSPARPNDHRDSGEWQVVSS